MIYKPDGRLSSAAKFIRQGALFADIGTDHAYLPIFLLQIGRIDRAICSDINEGPLASAKEHAKAAGVFDKIDFILADGADGLSDTDVSDVAICGMGGELIADIITRAKFLQKNGVRLILQPMSRSAILRTALARLGYAIIEEDYSSTADKLYVTLVCEYIGDSNKISETEAEFGNERFLVSPTETHLTYLLKKRDALKKAATGKALGGQIDSKEARLYSFINNYLISKGR